MDLQAHYDRFTASRQEPVRLELALSALPVETDPARQEVYRQYLRRRLRPALAALAAAEDTEGLARIAALGWLEPKAVDEAIDLARREQRTAALVWLLRWKGEHYGYQDRDFSL